MERGGAARALLLVLAGLLAALLAEPLGTQADVIPTFGCPPCPPRPADCLLDAFIAPDKCHYIIDNNTDAHLEILTLSARYFVLSCISNVTLENPSLPRFERLVDIPHVAVRGCALPRGPYAGALRRLNVTTHDRLFLENIPAGIIESEHFLHLEKLLELRITTQTNNFLVASNSTVFDSLSSLTILELKNVRLPFVNLQNLTNLKILKLDNCGPLNLCKLPKLDTLIVDDKYLRSLTESSSPCNISNINAVTLSTMRLQQLPPLIGVKHLTIRTRILKFEECSSLEELEYMSNYRATLPERWLSACARLRSVSLQMLRLSVLPESAFAGLTALRHLNLTQTSVTTLPAALFQDTRQLTTLDLSYNKLTELPIGVFSPLTHLQHLDLSYNLLRGGAVSALAGLTSLHRLMLHNNPLGDLCTKHTTTHVTHPPSMLSLLNELEELSLAATGSTSICKDWREDMRHLSKLDLGHNINFQLKWEDLHGWDRKVEINLKGVTQLATVVTTYDDFTNAVPHTKDMMVSFLLDENLRLRCDCDMYWFAKAMSQHLVFTSFQTLKCALPSNDTSSQRDVPLEDFDLDLMMCPIFDGCPANCSCMRHPSEHSSSDERVLIECQNNMMTELPDLSTIESQLSNGSEIEMRVYNNSIRLVPENLSSLVREVDLRNNKLSATDERTARALLAGGRRVWLAGNTLDCSCNNRLMAALRVHFKQIMDFKSVQCKNGELLHKVVFEGCSGMKWLWLAAGATVALAVAAGVAFALRRNVRLRLKAFLLARGLCLYWVRPDDDDNCKFDAFLSYAHEDEEIARALMVELESGARPLRLCVHARDWRLGHWIPAQIAQSVKESRRTIILLSENFAKSSWARAEFREAYAHSLRDNAVRIIVIVVGDAPPADLDPDIRHYVSNNTYVRWGEPAFWEKLRVALPPGRVHPQRHRTKRPKSTRPPPPTLSHHRPSLRVEPPVHPAKPQPPTPIVKFAHLDDFPAPMKPTKTPLSKRPDAIDAINLQKFLNE